MIYMLYTLHGGSTVRVLDSQHQQAVAREHIDVAKVVGVSQSHPTYDGSYSITPMAFIDQTLTTSGKILKDDVVVFEVPYIEASNDAGGITVSIAS